MIYSYRRKNILFISMVMILGTLHCYQPPYYFATKPASSRLDEVSRSCPAYQKGRPLYLISSACLQAVKKQLPLDRKSFAASEDAKAHADALAKLLAWLLSSPELKFPQNGLVLDKKELVIPTKYYCQLAPQLKPTECGFNPSEELNPPLTVNQQLYLHLLNLVEKFIDDPKPSSNLAQAKRYFVRKQGTVKFFPTFWTRNLPLQTTILFHEIQHFYHEPHIHCPKDHPLPGKENCDLQPFSGPFGATLVVAELFRQMTLETSPSLSISPEHPQFLYQRNQNCNGKEICLTEVLGSYCNAIANIIQRSQWPQGLYELCTKDYKNIAEYSREAAIFIQAHPELFSTSPK